jgi:hypothetical protein
VAGTFASHYQENLTKPHPKRFSCLTGAGVESSYQKTDTQYLALCKHKNVSLYLENLKSQDAEEN